jgi:prepilin-type N-terminal cleavage/methylation domain-containing protein
MFMKKNSGFTLIELMIVVAIIAIIAAIAIPNLLRSRMSANEAGATGAVRTISTGEAGFQAAGIVSDAVTGIAEYGDLTELGAGTTPFIDQTLALGTKQGYNFVATPALAVGVASYTATAQPGVPGSSGIKTFFVDESGVIRFQGDGTNADATSPPMN